MQFSGRLCAPFISQSIQRIAEILVGASFAAFSYCGAAVARTTVKLARTLAAGLAGHRYEHHRSIIEMMESLIRLEQLCIDMETKLTSIESDLRKLLDQENCTTALQISSMQRKQRKQQCYRKPSSSLEGSLDRINDGIHELLRE